MDFVDHRRHIDALMQAALEAADPAARLSACWPEIESKLDPRKDKRVVGAGKASLDMALALNTLTGRKLTGGAITAVPERLENLSQAEIDGLPFRVYPAAHPLPDERNIIAAEAIAGVARQATADDILICLISGGGSAHLTLPVRELTLADLQEVAQALLYAGAPIQDLNTVRKHCEQLKGGGLLRLAAPAQVYACILSDVIGDSLDVIASGPTSPDPTTYQDALEVLDRYDIALPESVRQHLIAGAKGERLETLKPGDDLLGLTHHTILGSNILALDAVKTRAEELGFHIHHFESGVQGEARDVGKRLGDLARKMGEKANDRPLCAILGGETTVTVTGGGRGGRNQEMALAAAIAIEGMRYVVVATFSTDGIDGPTDAAGAFVTGQTYQKAVSQGRNPRQYLDDNDSYTLFSYLDNLLITGPTGTNVNDLAVVLVYRK